MYSGKSGTDRILDGRSGGTYSAGEIAGLKNTALEKPFLDLLKSNPALEEHINGLSPHVVFNILKDINDNASTEGLSNVLANLNVDTNVLKDIKTSGTTETSVDKTPSTDNSAKTTETAKTPNEPTTPTDAKAQGIAFLKDLGAEVHAGDTAAGSLKSWFKDVTGIGELSETAGLKYTIKSDGPDKGKEISLSVDATEAQQNDFTQALIKDAGMEKTFAAVTKALPEAAETIELIKANPKLAQAFHNALANDDTMIDGLRKLTDPKAEGEFSLTDLNKALKSNILVKGVAVSSFTKALNLVSQSEEHGFEHLVDTANDLKSKAAGMDFKTILHMAYNDPEALVTTLFAGTGLEGTQMGDFFAGLLKNFAPFLAMFVDPNGAMLGPYVKLGKNIWDSNVHDGADMRLNPKTAEDDSYLRNGLLHHSVEDFAEEYNKIETNNATKGIPSLTNSNEDLLNGLASIDKETRHEVKMLINELDSKDGAIREAVNTIRTSDNPAEGLFKMTEFMAEGGSPKHAVIAAANGTSLTDFRAERDEIIDARIEENINVSATVDFNKVSQETFKANLTKTLTGKFEKAQEHTKEVENGERPANNTYTVTGRSVRIAINEVDPSMIDELQAMSKHDELNKMFDNLTNPDQIEATVNKIADMRQEMVDGHTIKEAALELAHS